MRMIRRFFGERSNEPKPTPQGGEASTPPADAEQVLGRPIQRVPVSLKRYEKMDLRHRRFDDMNANKAEFVDCDFSYSVFDRAYFHGAIFRNCNFIGCKFYDSNFRGASFPGSDFKYATFHRTLLDAEEMIALLPQEPNLKRDALQNLRANAAEIGNFSSERQFVLAEIEAAVDHELRILRGKEDYYRRKYQGLIPKLLAFIKYVSLKFSGLLWGHGERPLLLLVSGTFFVLMLSLVNFWAVMPKIGWNSADSGFQILKY